jgi:AcrR family transcriptional regulator
MQGGIAAPPTYQHFANRDELVQAVAADSFQRLDAVPLEAMNSVADPAATVRACCHAYCRFGLEHPGHYQVLFTASLALDPARRGDRPGVRVFERLGGPARHRLPAYQPASPSMAARPHARQRRPGRSNRT